MGRYIFRRAVSWGLKTWFFFFYFKSGFNEPTGKSEETVEMTHLRKSSVTEAKMLNAGGGKHLMPQKDWLKKAPI